jgi:carboxypeptidase Taq
LVTELIGELKERLAEIQDLRAAAAVLAWDQATYMPPGGAASRGHQMATLGKLAQERATSPELGTLLEELKGIESDLDYDSDEAGLIRIGWRDFERSVKVPPSFLARFYEHSAHSFDEWTRARPANDFSRMRSDLERTLDLSREFGEFFPEREHLADPLIQESDYGMTVSQVQEIFQKLRAGLIPIVESITSMPALDRGPVLGKFDESDQLTFGRQVARAFGYDFDRGRQDKTHHPFMTRFSIGDVRITTRARADDLTEALFSTLHETGHALYEQGIDPQLERTPLARGTSSGMHESQSRLWENIVGRSQPFWEHYYPILQSTFPDQLSKVRMDDFYRAINSVQRSLIRTDADEVTYNLHVMIRFDLELQLLEGDLEVRHLPQSWNHRYESDLGLAPPDDRDGVLQDVHWYAGFIGGAFQGYTLGNIMAAQIFEVAIEADPGIPDGVSRGSFSGLHNWLQTNLYRHGRKFTANELLDQISGGPLTVEPYLNYLKTKFGSLFDVEL